MPCVGFGQGFAAISEPTKLVETYIEAGRLNHRNHPVLSWNAANLTVAEDATGNVRPAKDKSAEKIDGMVCLIMAAAVHSTSNQVEQNWKIFEL